MKKERVNEAQLIALIKRTVKERGHLKVGIGDDACVLSDGKTVFTTDAYAQGVHFDLRYMDYFEIGSRCACACLSDVVAMGAEPLVLLVSLCLPHETKFSKIKSLYQGMEKVCRKLGGEIGGGDIIASDRLVLSLSALGRTDKPLLRCGARPGDFVYLTGYAGLAETGRILLAQKRRSLCSISGAKEAIARHLFPLPRIEVMRQLKGQMGALIDTSDGLATDARHIAEMSNVRIIIHPEKIPMHKATVKICQLLDKNPFRFCLTAGEDYELLFTTKEKMPSRIANIPVSVIGRVERGRGLYYEEKGVIRAIKEHGYDHLDQKTG
ncbi:MAG: thiamine-phosphate kinase [candidate division WOR-3 bacterium]